MSMQNKTTKPYSILSLVIVSFIILSMTMFSNVALADAYPPTFSNELPQNDSYMAGGEKLFQVNINDNELDTSTAMLKIISLSAYEQSEPWDSYLMSCDNSTPTDWVCNKTLSFAIVGSDTAELFYFEATDDDSNYNSSGSSTNPYVVTLDRNPPIINFINPANNSYVSGVEEIQLEVTDSSSGVNDSSVEYSNDSVIWENASFVSPYFVANWNTTSFSDNQTVTLYARAADNIDNMGYEQIGLIVENELPKIIIITPTGSQKETGIIGMEINVSEIYSGIGPSAASYNIEGIQGTMSCSGSLGSYTCQEYFDTTLLPDGNNTFNFTVTDNADNVNSSSVEVDVDNTMISVTIINPSEGGFVGGNEVYINATVSNADETVTAVKMKIVGYTYELTQEMNCSVSYVCFVAWNTTDVAEGLYTLTANVTNTEDENITDTVSINLDKTSPEMLIDAPVDSTVSGTIYPKVIVTDENGVDPSTVTYNISVYGSEMECVLFLSGKKFVCSSYFNTSQLSETYYDLYFYAKDSAGNLNSTRKQLLIDNVQGTGPSGDSNGGTTATTTGGSGIIIPPTDDQTTTTTNPLNMSSPIMIVLGDIQNVIAPLRGLLSNWPVTILVIAIIIGLIIYAFFREKAKLLLVRLKYELVFGADKFKMRKYKESEPVVEESEKHETPWVENKEDRPEEHTEESSEEERQPEGESEEE